MFLWLTKRDSRVIDAYRVQEGWSGQLFQKTFEELRKRREIDVHWQQSLMLSEGCQHTGETGAELEVVGGRQ